MVFTDMLVCLDSYPDASSTTAVDQCARLAAALGEGVCAVAAHVRIPLKSNLIANLLLDLSDVARTEEARSLQNAQNVLERFVTSASVAGLAAPTTMIIRADLQDPSERIVQIARTRSLCLIPQERIDDGQASLAEAVIFGSGRPAVVFAAGDQAVVKGGLDTVVVAWDGGRAAARTVADAMPVLSRAGEVRIVSVLNDKPSVSAGSATDLVRHLAVSGISAVLDEIDGRGQEIGRCLTRHAQDCGADLLVMGAFGHSRAREFILGGATQRLLREPIVPVFLSH